MNQLAIDFSARDEAIERVERNADDQWKDAAMAAIERLCRDCGPGYEFTTDSVIGLLASQPVTTHEPRALGAVMKRAAKNGLIRATDRMQKSVSSKCHNRPKLIWVTV